MRSCVVDYGIPLTQCRATITTKTTCYRYCLLLPTRTSLATTTTTTTIQLVTVTTATAVSDAIIDAIIAAIIYHNNFKNVKNTGGTENRNTVIYIYV